jgi:hypothetical protein
MDSKQTGPIYGAQLIELLKCGGMLQAMPSRSDLQEAQKKHTRVVAGYEVLLFKYHRLVECLEFLSGFDSLDTLMLDIIATALEECERKDEADSLERPEPFDEDLPTDITSLVGRCEIGEKKFDNDDMSQALKFGELLWKRLCRMAEHYERMAAGVEPVHPMIPSREAGFLNQAAKNMWHILEDTRKDCGL